MRGPAWPAAGATAPGREVRVRCPARSRSSAHPAACARYLLRPAGRPRSPESRLRSAGVGSFHSSRAVRSATDASFVVGSLLPASPPPPPPPRASAGRRPPPDTGVGSRQARAGRACPSRRWTGLSPTSPGGRGAAQTPHPSPPWRGRSTTPPPLSRRLGRRGA